MIEPCDACPNKAVRCDGCPQLTVQEAIAETPDAAADIEAHEVAECDGMPSGVSRHTLPGLYIIGRNDLP